MNWLSIYNQCVWKEKVSMEPGIESIYYTLETGKCKKTQKGDPLDFLTSAPFKSICTKPHGPPFQLLCNYGGYIRVVKTSGGGFTFLGGFVT